MDKKIQTGHSQEKKWKVLNVQINLRNASKTMRFTPIRLEKQNTAEDTWGRLRDSVIFMHCWCEHSQWDPPGDGLAAFY